MRFFKQLIKFIRDVAEDQRIPLHDKKVLLTLLGLIVSPIDFIPDWIPLLGVLDDLVMLALVLDYFFEILDQEILLSHYPWSMKSFARIRRISRMISWLTPAFIKDRLWKFAPSPYRK